MSELYKALKSISSYLGTGLYARWTLPEKTRVNIYFENGKIESGYVVREDGDTYSLIRKKGDYAWDFSYLIFVNGKITRIEYARTEMREMKGVIYEKRT